ncbi:hypothetical protein T11_2297 [Trichinella zimbabwensis]|uniref:Uncharacterized protein n=1 Tax=Trichinella zimbabwensis TaxID=268475 RepID=A0A0V1I2C9_9BILA|nr:hypothetical protein T11_2297 [Trichinella zimbabwensis]
MRQDFMKASGDNKLNYFSNIEFLKEKKEEITQNIPITVMNQQRRGTIATVRSLEKRQSINSSQRCSSSNSDYAVLSRYFYG